MKGDASPLFYSDGSVALELRQELGQEGRRTMRLRELPNWPPSPTAPNPPGRHKVPRPDQAVLKSVGPRSLGNRVAFTSDFEGIPHTYDFEAKHAKLAEHIELILHKHIGKSVMHLGDIEIDEDALIE